MNKILVFFLLLTFGVAHSQELNCTVTVNTDQLSNANQQVFKTLQTSLSEFVNQTNWTGQVFKQNEKINKLKKHISSWLIFFIGIGNINLTFIFCCSMLGVPHGGIAITHFTCFYPSCIPPFKVIEAP